MLKGGVFKDAQEKFGATVMKHKPEEELLGLPPPTETNIGTPEDHATYFKGIETKEEEISSKHACKYDREAGGKADWALPPPKPNDIDSTLDVDKEGGGKKGHGGENKKDAGACFEKEEKVGSLVPKMSPTHERELNDKEAVLEMELARKKRLEEEEEKRANGGGEKRLKRRSSWR